MSSWDKCCKGGKFNVNYAKTQKTTETLKKIDQPKEKEKQALTETSDEIQDFNSNKDEDSVKENIAPKVVIQFTFSELGLDSSLLNWIEFAGFSSPNNVQNTVLYHLSLEKRYWHYVIQAPKKSGKTSAALMWILNKILIHKSREYPLALMICPKIELADAAYKFVEQIARYCKIKVCFAKKGKKVKDGKITDDLIIATPDKALELSKSAFDLKKLKYLIVDEAHYMSDAKGHLKTLYYICSLLFPKVSHSFPKCTTILCTLFCNEVLNNFIEECLILNQRIEIENEEIKFPPKEIFIVYSNNEERAKAFICLEKSNVFPGQTVVFCKTKDELDRLKKALNKENICVHILSGDLTQLQRNSLLQQFKENNIKLLITTYTFMEVLEAENVSKVINYEQVLDSEYKLDPHIYEQIERCFNGRENCLIGSFIELKWTDALIEQSPGLVRKQVYAKAETVHADKLIDGQYFNK